MAIEDEMPPWMQRHLAVYAARSAHNFCAVRIRSKLINETGSENLLVEAFEMVRREIGPFPSEDGASSDPHPDEDEDQTERDMREIALRNYETLSETESYMWNLGIGGVFHQWERDTRIVIEALSDNPPKPEKLEKMSFADLCKGVERTGFTITDHSSFPALRLAHLIANTIKHGRGNAFRTLVTERPDLFHGGPVGMRMGNLPPQPHHLRVSERQFDEVVTAIDRIWLDYESISLSAQRGADQVPVERGTP